MYEAFSTLEVRGGTVTRVLKSLYPLNLQNCMTQLRLDVKKVNFESYSKSHDQTWVTAIATDMDSRVQRLSKEILVQYEPRSRLMSALGFALSSEVRERTPSAHNGTITSMS
jgi:hypothetical protein